MSIRILADVWRHSGQQGGALLVLLAIADFSNDHGEAYPSVQTLAQKSRLSTRQVQRTIRQICESGELVIAPVKGPKGCHKFRIQLDQPIGGDKMSGDGVTKCQCDKMSGDGVTPTSPNPSLKKKKEKKGAVTKKLSPKSTEKSWLQFWAAYPKRVAKKDARRAWDKLNPDQDLLQLILEKLAVLKNSDDWKKNKGQYIPFPATWLNGRRWEDEIKPTIRERLPL